MKEGKKEAFGNLGIIFAILATGLPFDAVGNGSFYRSEPGTATVTASALRRHLCILPL